MCVKFVHQTLDTSGLGLSIVKEFVQLHNGSIKVQDKAPSGSIFVVRIPRM